MDEVIIEALMFQKHDTNHTEQPKRNSCLYNVVKHWKTQNRDYQTKIQNYRKFH